MPSVIEAVKARERLVSLVLILNDPEAKQVMAAWQNKRPKFKDRELKNGEVPEEALMQVWENTDVNLSDLATSARLPLNVTVNTFNRLKSNRLIYPDGTIPEQADVLLQGVVRSAVRGMIPKQKAPNGKTHTG